MSITTQTDSPRTGLPGSLASGLENRPTALLFPGIDPAWQAVLAEALLGRPELTAWLEQVSAELDEWAATTAVRALGQFPDGFSPVLLASGPLASGLVAAQSGSASGDPEVDPDADLDERALAAPFLLVGSLLANLAHTSGLALEGLSVGSLNRGSAAGHSAGIMAAWLTATAAGPDGIVPVAHVVAAAQLMALMGAHTAGHRWTVSGDQTRAAARGDTGAATPMVAVSGPRLGALDAALAAARAGDDVVVAVANGPRQHVLSGDPGALAVLRARLEAVSAAQAAARSKGRHGGDVLDLIWEPLASPVAFHHPDLETSAREALAQAEALGVALPGDAGATIDLAVTPAVSVPRMPVVDPATAAPISGPGATGQVVRSILARPHDWVAALREVTANPELTPDGEMASDGGTAPSGPVAVVVSRLGSLGGTTAAALRGRGVTVVDPSTSAGRMQLFTPGSAPAQPLDYERYRPRVVRRADGTVSLVNRHTSATGRSPIVLAGMTPSTVGVPIVAAAANAGHVAELAGGGQVSERIFTLRMAELRESLDRGQEVVFNALNLDPYLWDLHLGKERLVQKARAAGAPINGVTVSAGIPPLEEALALLDELNEAGIWLNAFKPGTVGGVREVLAIAERTPHRVWLHLEGGAAGGHHSWEDLEDLLLETYHLIREHDNVLLGVGGGIGQPSRAAELLTGDWALAHGEAPMPVDAILLGTVAMATRESGASGSVKAALVAAAGHDSWVLRGQVAGGATSGRSGLDADIHFLENSAAAAARLLDEVAGDAEAVAARHDEIVEALSRTAKPYFGDLAEMTYEEVLRRFVELTAIGRHRRYDDGAWLDVTHRARFVALLQLAEARLDARDTGEVPTLFADSASVDDPVAAVEALLAAHPVARTALLHPADVAAFRTIARMPGKPVPFVPVIDADVRRWYQSDALWQAHDDRYDADQVLIIPGPRAVGGIQVVDEPVAGLLDRFESEVAGRLGAPALPSGVAGVPRGPGAQQLETAAGLDFRLGIDRHVPATEPVLWAALAAPTWLWLGASRPNPLRRIAPAEQWQFEDHRATWSAEQAGGPSGESATLEVAEGGGVRLSIRWPSLGRSGDGELVVPVEATSQAGVVTFTVTAEGLSAAGASLLAMFARPAGSPAGRGAHAATVGAHAELPDAVMAQLWPEIFTRLAEVGLADSVLDLVHATHHVIRPTVPIDSDAPSVDRPTITRTDRGHLVTVRSTAGGLAVRDGFFVRRALVDRSLPLETVVERAQEHIDTPRRTLGRLTLTAPRHLESFAMVSGDLNPIHRSDALARMVGLPGRIVHGMWTSAAATRAVIERAAGGRSDRLRRWSVEFVAPVLPGEQVEVTVTRVGLRDGARVVEVEVTAASGLVARGVAEVAPPRTVHVFPGQGIQAQGMGMDAYATSPAARGVWDEADRITRERLGFSILEVVRGNPASVQAGGAVHRHPAGVLHLTQFTQVAMATLASAQVAQLREAGAFDPSAVVAGHSVGEYNALAASSTVLSLPALIELVFARGQSMHGLVPRDEQGQSDYRLGVIRPHLAGLSHAQAEELVAGVAQQTGQLCEIVNHNLRGKQYAVAGTVTALETLAQRLGEGTPGRAPLVYVPGIDVPFHSSALTPGVDRFREHLRAQLPERVDPAELVGRYIPNLYPRLFSLDRDFVAGVEQACGSPVLAGVLADWDAASADPATLARTLLVELLAWQFASPVRWIDTFELLTAKDGPAVERFVEIGVGSAPTLANLAKGSLALPTHEGTRPVVLNLELDGEAVFQSDTDPTPAPAAVADDFTASPHEAASPQAPLAAPVTAAPGGDAPADAPVDHATALAALLALRVGARPEQLGTDTVDVLVDGASSRRNQVLMDLGKEFSVPAIDGAHEAPLPDLVSNLAGRSVGYRYPGPVLAAAVESGLTSALGPRGGTPGSLARRVERHWGLGAGWVDRTSLELVLGTREGTSKRGGPLGELDGATADELIDAAVRAAGSRAGVTVAPVATTTAGGPVDAAAVTALRDHVEGVMAEQATDLLTKLGRDTPQPYDEAAGAAQRELAERLALLESEHGAAKQVAATFDPARHVMLASADTWVRNDVEQLVQSSIEAEVAGAPFPSPEALDQIAVHRDAEPRIAEALRYHRERLAYSHPRTAGLLDHALALEPRGLPVEAGAALPEVAELSARPGQLAGQVALVTGASPGSIAHAALAHLLRGGATTIVVTTNDDEGRIAGYRDLERRCAAPGASLHVVRANLASFADIDAVLDWLTTPTVEQVGAASRQVKPALWPTLVLPFAAAPAGGDLPDAREDAQTALRLLLLGVQRLVGGLAQRVAAADRDPFTVVLPLSPNHGTFGGDGAYGEAKAALETMFARWHSEAATWGRSTRLIGAEIGWVRGTGLMAGNDRLAEAVERRLGITTWSAEQIGAMIAALALPTYATRAAAEPLRLDLSGGLGGRHDVGPALRAAATEAARAGTPDPTPPNAAPSTVPALPNLPEALLRGGGRTGPAAELRAPRISADEMVVIVGIAELGPLGGSTTRWQAESGGLQASGVVELAWRTGLIEWDEAAGRWRDAATKEPVAQSAVADRYRDEVRRRTGIRPLSVTVGVAADGYEQFTEAFLDRPLTRTVASLGEARALASGTESATVHESDGTWSVTFPAGAAIRIPTRRMLSRSVGGQFPDGVDPVRHGLDGGAAGSMDPLAAWNLVVTAEALADAGVTPEELVAAVHPSLVGNTQGSGMGGMSSIRTMYMAPATGRQHANDVLQEALGNVVPAHTNQGLIGGYGPMVHPVAACATAAVSLEEAVDKIRLGKAHVVVAGGWDDLSTEGINGFADMAATADNEAMIAAGLAPHQHSRPGDRRRRGFVEAQGGGSFLVVRGSVALALGLPVRAVVAYAASFGDGINTSIPAPGLGALGAARGGTDSPLARGLADLGLGADDVAVVSKHDTSTQANDPNEAFIHATIQRELGRTPGAALRVISQKALTGHSKGGAAAWQIAGLCDVFETGIVPGNPNLVSVDPAVTPGDVLVDHRPLRRHEPVRAALLTSLGFGHVSAVVALAHPDVFLAGLSDDQRADHLARADRRRVVAARRRLASIHGGEPLLTRRTERPLTGAAEAEMLLGRSSPEPGRAGRAS